MAPFKNDCGQKNPNQTVQASKKHFLKMTVAKKTEPNSVRCKMAPFKNDCGQKNPIQAVQVTKWRLLKMIVAKKLRSKQCKIQNGTFQK